MIRSTDAKTPAGTAYRIAGDGSPLVLIHGVGLSKEMWGGQLAGLAPRYQVIAYDMLGHGESQRPAAQATLDDYAAQLTELLDHLGLATAVVVGFSMGGLVARAFALGHPQRLDALVILNSVFNRSVEQRSGVLERTARPNSKAPTPTWIAPWRAGSAASTRAPTRRRSRRCGRPSPAMTPRAI